MVFREAPEVTNSGETSVWWAIHQQYSTWNRIHKQHPHFPPELKYAACGGSGNSVDYIHVCPGYDTYTRFLKKNIDFEHLYVEVKGMSGSQEQQLVLFIIISNYITNSTVPAGNMLNLVDFRS